jgi:SIT family siderophore-iron:H+ symporter-like MFS transporter
LLIVAYGQTSLQLGFIQNVYSFVSTCTGILVGLAVMKVRRLKPFICAGAILFMVAFGLLVRYRGSVDGSTHELAGYIGAEVVLGVGAGCFSYPTQAAVQARTKHERVAVVTGLYLAAFRVGSAIGSAISGAVWTQRMLPTLNRFIADPDIALSFYTTPLTVYSLYPIGSDVRTGAIEAYREVARILSIIGICLSALIIVWAFLLRDPKLGNTQSLENAEELERAGSQASSVDTFEKEKYDYYPWYKRIWFKFA